MPMRLPLRKIRHLCALLLTIPTLGFAFSSGCEQETNTLCRDVEPGEGRLTSCIIRNKTGFSSTCTPEVLTFIESRRQFTQACKAERKKLCPSITTGKGQLYSCLKLNEHKLSTNCRQKVE